MNRHLSLEHRKSISKAKEGKPRKGNPLSWKHTNETKKKISEHRKGMKLSEETRIKISLKLKGKRYPIRSEEYRNKMSVIKKGTKVSKETRTKQSKASKGKKKGPQTEEARKKNSEWHINNPNKKFKNTIIEQKIAKELERRGFVRDVDFYQNKGLANIANVDFYLPESRTVIECDGCFYHACESHNPVWSTGKERRERDKLKTTLLKLAGYNVYRFWGHEIHESPENCIDQIKEVCLT